MRVRLRDGYWLIPAVCLVAAGVLAFVLVRVDDSLQRRGAALAFTGGPDSARSVLGTISTSMLSLTALVFSITMVVLQLASTQFSPRALPTFLRDRQSQLTLGVFLGTFGYSLLALREVRGTDALTEPFVPGVTIAVAFLLVLVSIVFFVAYIHHIATSIQVATILQRIEAEALRSMKRDRDAAGAGDEPAAEPLPPETGDGRTVISDRAGTFAGVDVHQLVGLARDQDAVVRLLPRPGDFVARGAPLLVVAGDPAADNEAWRGAVRLVRRRDDHSDVTLALRQLVDIAERALSPGVNDPSTAVQCLDRLHDVLRRLAEHPYPREVHCDGDGRPRLVTPQVRWDDHVGMVLDELRLWGAGSLQVRERLQRMVDDLLTVTPPERQGPLRARLPLFRQPLEIG
jgi:uncharacterized membrane protein